MPKAFLNHILYTTKQLPLRLSIFYKNLLVLILNDFQKLNFESAKIVLNNYTFNQK